jgi:hypothetical protein
LSEEHTVEIENDLELLKLMMQDAHRQPPLYHPGPYWESKAKSTAEEIKRYGLADFRGATNAVGLSYTDSLHVDVLHSFNHGVLRRMLRRIMRTYPLSKIRDD